RGGTCRRERAWLRRHGEVERRGRRNRHAARLPRGEEGEARPRRDRDGRLRRRRMAGEGGVREDSRPGGDRRRREYGRSEAHPFRGGQAMSDLRQIAKELCKAHDRIVRCERRLDEAEDRGVERELKYAKTLLKKARLAALGLLRQGRNVI